MYCTACLILHELFFLFLPCLVGLAGRAKQDRSYKSSASQSIDSVDYIQYLAMSIHFSRPEERARLLMTFDDFSSVLAEELICLYYSS